MIAFVHEIKVVNTDEQEEEPSEAFMRLVEDHGKVAEKDVVAFRVQVVEQLPLHRMDVLYDKLGFVFEYMALAESDEADLWLAHYPYVLPLAEPDDA